MFPSPCGDMVLKYDTDRGGLSRDEVSVPLRGYGFEIIAALSGCRGPFSFPSPCGDMVLKSACVALLQLVYGTEFPSPCGDMVLKCPLRRDALLCLAQYAVLRRGCIFPPFHGDTAF